MNNKIYIYVAGCLFLMLASTGQGAAQTEPNENRTPASVELLKMRSLWSTHTENTAGALIDRSGRYGDVNFRYQNVDGDYKQAQIGKKVRTLGFHTEGGGTYEDVSGMYFWGMFDYANIRIYDAEYNALLYDPLRGIPFILADSHKSDWHNMEYNLTAKIASPLLWNRIVFGIKADYMAAQGAKQRDPRPRMDVSKFTVIPSIVLCLNKKHSVGGDFRYSSRREDGTASTLVSMNSEIGYDYMAPGFFVEGSLDAFGSLDTYRRYKRNSYGGGVQYNYKTKKFDILVAGRYISDVEDIMSVPSKSKMVGTVRDDVWSAKITSIYYIAPKHMISMTLEYNDRKYEGIQYVQEYDNTLEVQQWIIKYQSVRSEFKRRETNINLDYLIGGYDNSYKWKFGIYASLDNDSDIYHIPHSTQDIKNNRFGAYAKANILLWEDNFLQVGVYGGLSKNKKSERDYNGIMADHPVYQDFDMRDYSFLSSEYDYFKGSLSYVNSGLIKGGSSLYATAEFTYRKASDFKDLFDKRQYLTLNIGMTF